MLEINYTLARNTREEALVDQLAYAADVDLAQPAALLFMALEQASEEVRAGVLATLKLVCDEAGIPEDGI